MTSSFSSTSTTMVVTREEFNAFHKIDRTLFTRLVFGLNRDMNESFQVIGFLLLLEQHSYVRNFVANLISLPDSYIVAVANEIVKYCLSFLYQDCSTFFVSYNDDDHLFIPSIRRHTGGKLTLRSIHENREAFLRRLRKNLSDICYQAFEDICLNAERYREERQLALEREKVIEDMKKIKLSGPQVNSSRLLAQQERVYTSVEEETNKTEMVTEEAVKKEKVVVVVEDDRTVFLTFSKGYPVSETEVRVFFTKEFGEVIETIRMEKVKENNQPLYAKMILKMKCVSKIEDIVGREKNKRFIIDGKHVVARKYVPKNPNFSTLASSSRV